jgi:S1-C subfamily serine protease
MSTEAETELVPEPVRDTTLALKRETILPSSDRGRLAAIVATCSLAGLAGGMALSMLAETHRAVQATHARAALDDAPITWLGVRITDVDPHACAGAMVNAVTPDSPASAVGIHLRDVVVGFGGDHVCGMDAMIDVVRASRIGSSPEIRVRRGTEELVLHPTLGTMPDAIRQLQR